MKNILKLFLFLIILFIISWAFSLILKKGLDRGYGLNEHSKILIIGHSHLMMGLDRAIMEKELQCKVTKYTRSGVGMQERHLMVKQYLNSQYSDSLQLAILGVDPFSFNRKGLSENCYTLFYPFIDDKEIANYIRQNSSLPEYIVHKIFHLSRYSDDLLTASIRGWKRDDQNYKKDTLTVELMNRRINVWKRDISFNPALINELETCIEELTERGIHVILLNTPISRPLNQSQPKEYKEIIEYYHNLDKSSDFIDFIDYSPIYENDFSLFFDPIHLNVKGQEIITEKVIRNIEHFHLSK